MAQEAHEGAAVICSCTAGSARLSTVMITGLLSMPSTCAGSSRSLMIGHSSSAPIAQVVAYFPKLLCRSTSRPIFHADSVHTSRMSTSAIQHIVVMPTSIVNSRQSLFQRFSLDLYPHYAEIVSALVHFPHDMLDAGLSGQALVASKMAGASLSIRMLRLDLIDEAHCELKYLPTVIWSTAPMADEVDATLARFSFRPLHLTLGEHERAVSLSSLTPETTRAHLAALADRAARTDKRFSMLVDALRALPVAQRNEGLLPFAPGMHNSTRPLANVLGMYGYQFDNAHAITAALDNAPYIESMVQMANVIDGLRKLQPTPIQLARKNDAIIYCPSIVSYLYRTEEWNPIVRNLSRDKRKFIKDVIVRNKGFSNATIQIKAAFNPYEDSTLASLLRQRQFELQYFTALVSVLAVNQFAPALRLPGSVMLHHDMLAEIYALVNSDKKNRLAELNKRLTVYGQTIQEEIGVSLWNAAFGDRERLFLICDFPAEWLPIELVPAMFRYEISRIPSTPGNLTNELMFGGPRIVFPSKLFNRVLIIRSFGENDPIRDHLHDAIKQYSLEELSVEFVDVSGTNELIEAMNRFDGAILILDCHGNHGGKKEHAWLQIGKQRVDIWELANIARVPPIVILAACSTHPLNGSHASVANGFLRCGALSVLGTFAPVLASHTAILVARLLYRVQAFLPLITKHRLCTWRELVSGFMRMSYATDVLLDLEHGNFINEAQFKDIHFKANTDINTNNPEWLANMQRRVVEAAGLTDAEIRSYWAEHFQFVETMLFVQLGRPESIVIANDDALLSPDSPDIASF